MRTSSDTESFHQRIEEARAKQLPKCSCKDPNECDTWCVDKERFAQAYDGPIVETPIRRIEGSVGHAWDHITGD
ncbi:hypothetical protein OB13_10875 [Pontibacter sp. HJ8]